MASWDPTADSTGAKRSDLRCLACGRPLDDALALAGSLRCLDCRESNAALTTQLMSGPEQTAKAGFASGPRRPSDLR
jgi:hypothetical protein